MIESRRKFFEGHGVNATFALSMAYSNKFEDS